MQNILSERLDPISDPIREPDPERLFRIRPRPFQKFPEATRFVSTAMISVLYLKLLEYFCVPVFFVTLICVLAEGVTGEVALIVKHFATNWTANKRSL